MATATMATAAGAAALLYYTLNKKLQTDVTAADGEENDNLVQNHGPLGVERVSNRLIQAPATWLETISTLSETLRFTYSETLGKWPIGDLAFGISYLLKRQGNLHVSSVFGSKESLQLAGPEIVSELRYLLDLLTLCWHFSKKTFPVFLEETGFSTEDVLIQEPKAGILKPAFTILVNHKTKTFLLLIRGTHSIKDTLTAATGAVVPFHHTVVHEGGVSDVILGYAHCGMVAAARWIAKLATPVLLKALQNHPDYKLQIVGHSLGGGTAALLTYVLREQKELSSTTCVTFAPGACMTWELADSGNEFITSVINGADLVPTFSAASVDDLRAEVTASAWLNDLRTQIEHTRILKTVYRSATALGSRLPSIASAKAKVAGAGQILRPVSSGTQVVMRRAQSMAQAAWTRPSIDIASWSCMGPRRRPVVASSNSPESSSSNNATESISTALEFPVSSSSDEATTAWHSDEPNADVASTHEDRMTEFELWEQLEHELYDQSEGQEEADVAKEMREEEEAAIAEGGKNPTPETKEAHRFFPAGKIMHIVTIPQVAERGTDDEASSSESDDDERNRVVEDRVGLFLTPRSLYSKIRLSRSMITDHFMPVYRRQIEKLIRELEKDDTSLKTGEIEVVL
ncbi:putative fungal lipase-like domain, mono-/di-acylglycerol lipase, alpha/Beta hydrolase [Helianthus annuus]|nr:putative fungal lipase-like domain, mono-/di-acylglycerol lipase, alpha/Beta hydrolase [Helianthus annuus]KAJ0890982.1 putative fungal lipase-like domain, mono-/di-acylglycerol lipase, alpha/Beta hydrolase [Helianthus annuus]